MTLIVEILIFFLLIIGCITDIKTRTVSNCVILFIILAALPLIYKNQNQFTWSYALIVFILYAAWRFKGMGAADVKALIPVTLTLSLLQIGIFYSFFLLLSIILKTIYKKGAPLFVAILAGYIAAVVIA